MCDGPIAIRVCTYGGEGRCSGGDGEAAVAALRFLSPETGFEITSCSCLARCDRGVVAQNRNDGTFEEGLNDAKACSRWLRRLGVSTDARLRDAFDQQRAGAEFEEAGEMVKALEAYNRAFGLASAAGLGDKWRSRPSPVLKGESAGLRSTSNAYEAETPKASPAQLAWLSSLMVARSRVFSFLAGQKWPKAQLRALEDAQYAVQIAGAVLPSRLRPMPSSVPVVNLAAMDDGIPRAAAWERLAEASEAMQDIEGAITAYEQVRGSEFGVRGSEFGLGLGFGFGFGLGFGFGSVTLALALAPAPALTLTSSSPSSRPSQRGRARHSRSSAACRSWP